MDVAIGFDTSCYTTSAAAVDSSGQVVGFQRMLLPVASGQRGLRQSEAVFAHVRQMPQILEAMSPSLSGAKVCAVAVSAQPRDNDDSYMPVFTVGTGHASALASVLHVPLYRFSHQQGHISAGMIGNAPMKDRFLALHISGGTTELLLNEAGALRLIGGSKDLHAGQLLDRIGVSMGMRFPAGAELEKAALCCQEETTALLPVSMEAEDCYCHLSGAETKCQQLLQSGRFSNERVAAEAFDFLARTIARMLVAGCKRYAVSQALIVGGVASSSLLREKLSARVLKLGCSAELCFGKPEYSSDNAAGIARLGMIEFLRA